MKGLDNSGQNINYIIFYSSIFRLKRVPLAMEMRNGLVINT